MDGTGKALREAIRAFREANPTRSHKLRLNTYPCRLGNAIIRCQSLQISPGPVHGSP